MCLLALISFLVLIAYLVIMYKMFGLPSMISDTYYQLESKKRGSGWLFTAVLWIVSFSVLLCLLDTGEGIQAFAFLGCAGLAFVGAAPQFKEQDVRNVHRLGAIVAAAGGIGWCLSVCDHFPACCSSTALIALQYFLYLLRCRYRKNMSHIGYWAEASAILDVYITYWLLLVML